EQAQKFYEESLCLWRELSDKLGIVMCLNNLGILASQQENYEQTKKLYEESLILGREIGDKIGIVQSLIGFSEVLCDGNHLSRSVILLGAVETALKSIGLILQTKMLKFHKQIVNVLHEKLSNEQFEKYFEEGKKLTLDQAVEQALSNDQ
ncbi:MAG: tetratricopeptide repeat protein, partial [bacterium]